MVKHTKYQKYSIRTWKDYKTGKPIKYYVAVDKIGNVISRRRVDKAQMSFLNAQETHKKTGTFFKDKFQSKTQLGDAVKGTNYAETSKTKVSKLENRFKPVRATIPKGAIVQYVVEGELTFRKKFKNGGSGIVTQLVSARSGNLRADNPSSENTAEAKKDAWESFFERVHYISNNKNENLYDADEGLKIAKTSVDNVREGWVTYNKIK